MSDESTAAARLYEPFAERYHLIFEDWEVAQDAHGAALDRLLRAEGLAPPATVLDCTCGIGTQALPLARLGWTVTATDVTPSAVARAAREAAERRIPMATAVADVRALTGVVAGPFDAVISADNALPHLQTEADLAAAFRSIHAVLRPGGVFVATIRDYDAALETRPPGIVPWTFGSPGRRRLMAQAWWWDDVVPAYDFDMFLLEEGEGDGGGWRTTHVAGRYRAWRRSEMGDVMAAAGFEQVRWLTADEAGMHQPTVVARRSPADAEL